MKKRFSSRYEKLIQNQRQLYWQTCQQTTMFVLSWEILQTLIHKHRRCWKILFTTEIFKSGPSCVRACLYVCVCVCVWERERERDYNEAFTWTSGQDTPIHISVEVSTCIYTLSTETFHNSLYLCCMHVHTHTHTHTTEFGEWETGRNIYIMYTCKFRSAWCSKRTIRIIKMQGELLWTSVLILLCHMIVYKAAFCGLKMFRQNLDRKTVEDTEVREKELIPFLKGGLNQL